jgi:hypothetical protein
VKIGDSVWARVSEPPTSIDYASFEDFGLVVIDHFGRDRELVNVESGVLIRLLLFSFLSRQFEHPRPSAKKAAVNSDRTSVF